MASPDGKKMGGREREISDEEVQRSLAERVYGAIAAAGRSLKETFFGPSKPPQPAAQEQAHGRQWDYPFAVNALAGRPRSEQSDNAIDFVTLRRLADPALGGLDLLRLAIETRKDQMAGAAWKIAPRDKAYGDGGERARAIEKALRKPDGVNTYRNWQRMLLEDSLVIDAATVYLHKTKLKPSLPPLKAALPPAPPAGDAALPAGEEQMPPGQEQQPGAKGPPGVPGTEEDFPPDMAADGEARGPEGWEEAHAHNQRQAEGAGPDAAEGAGQPQPDTAPPSEEEQAQAEAEQAAGEGLPQDARARHRPFPRKKQAAIEAEFMRAFDPTQPRDDQGRWTDAAGAAAESADTAEEHVAAMKYHRERAAQMRDTGRPKAYSAHMQAATAHRDARYQPGKFLGDTPNPERLGASSRTMSRIAHEAEREEPARSPFTVWAERSAAAKKAKTYQQHSDAHDYHKRRQELAEREGDKEGAAAHLVAAMAHQTAMHAPKPKRLAASQAAREASRLLNRNRNGLARDFNAAHVPTLMKGDLPGHPFHGNQYADGEGGEPEAAPAPAAVDPVEAKRAKKWATKDIDPAVMTGGQINKELDRLDAVSSEINQAFIDAGRGYEKPSETWKKEDPLALHWKRVGRRQDSLRNEISARYGPDAPRRLPSGFGPRRKAEKAEEIEFMRGDLPGHPFRGNQYTDGEASAAIEGARREAGDSAWGEMSPEEKRQAIGARLAHDKQGQSEVQGKTGEPSTAESERHRVPDYEGLVGRMEKALKEKGGFTFTSRGNTPTEGFAVGVMPSLSGKFEKSRASGQAIKTWLQSIRPETLNDKRLCVGGWVDDNGQVWLDLVRVYPPTEREHAIRMGKRLNQISIADLAAIRKGDMDHAFINTGGTGEAQKADDGSGAQHYFLFPGDVTEDQILDAILGEEKPEPEPATKSYVNFTGMGADWVVGDTFKMPECVLVKALDPKGGDTALEFPIEKVEPTMHWRIAEVRQDQGMTVYRVERSDG